LTTKLNVFVVIAIVAAVVCVRLGIWQLHRLDERKARNAVVASHLNAPPIDAREIPRDTTEARFRRVRVTGIPDFEHELIHASRTRRGSPGVNLFTPVRIPGSDTAILVNRGWVYSPDGSTIDLVRWREHDPSFVGYAVEFPPTGGAAFRDRPSIIARLSYDVVSKAVPYPVSPTYVIALAEGNDTTSAANRIARLPGPALDDGPHFSYAIQWFGFATVALVGAAIVVKQSRGNASKAPDHHVSSGANELR
jgi:surfeit locus 1 family protein